MHLRSNYFKKKLNRTLKGRPILLSDDFRKINIRIPGNVIMFTNLVKRIEKLNVLWLNDKEKSLMKRKEKITNFQLC